MLPEASTHNTHGSIECRSDVIVHALDKEVIRLTSLAATNQYLPGEKCGRENERTTWSAYHRNTHPHQSRTLCSGTKAQTRPKLS